MIPPLKISSVHPAAIYALRVPVGIVRTQLSEIPLNGLRSSSKGFSIFDTTWVKFLQKPKTPNSIPVTLEGIVIDVKSLQLSNALYPMPVTPSGIMIEVKPLMRAKACDPILATLLGISVFLHPCIKVFDAVSMMALHFSRLSNVLFFLSTVIAVKPSQS